MLIILQLIIFRSFLVASLVKTYLFVNPKEAKGQVTTHSTSIPNKSTLKRHYSSHKHLFRFQVTSWLHRFYKCLSELQV